MSFISYKNFTERALKGPGVMMDKLLNIGDIVDSKIIDKYREEMSPLRDTAFLFQMGEAYVYSQDVEGVSQPCYLTFSFKDNDWVFCGACFEKSMINRCDVFDYAMPTVAQYCVDKYYSEYVRAAEKLHADEQRGVDVSNLSVIDDYMKFNPYVMAGYYFDVYRKRALSSFISNSSAYKNDSLYEPVVNLLEQRDKLISADVLYSHQQVDSVSSLISNATERMNGCRNPSDVVKENIDFEM